MSNPRQFSGGDIMNPKSRRLKRPTKPRKPTRRQNFSNFRSALSNEVERTRKFGNNFSNREGALSLECCRDKGVQSYLLPSIQQDFLQEWIMLFFISVRLKFDFMIMLLIFEKIEYLQRNQALFRFFCAFSCLIYRFLPYN